MTAFVGKFVMWFILVAVIVSAGNAIVRKLLNWSSNSLLELQWYLFGAAFMGAAAYTLQMNEHVRIDIFYASRTRRTQHWIDLFGHVFFTLPFVVLMTWMLIPYALQAYNIGQVSNNAGGLLIWPARAILAAGFVLLVAQVIAEIIKKVAIMRGLIEDPHPFISAHEAAEKETETLVKVVVERSGDKL